MQSSLCEEHSTFVNRAHQMQSESHTLSAPPSNYQYHPVRSTEATPHISGPDSDYERLSDGRVPGATFTDPYTPMNPSFGNPTSNMGYNYSSFQVAGFGEQPQHSYQGNQNVAHHGPPSGTAQHISNLLIGPGPLSPEQYAPPAHLQEMLNDGIIGHVPQPPNVTFPSQGVSGPVPPGVTVGEELRQLVMRCLQNHDSRRSGKVKVVIVLELDDTE
ncbi:hypothetical protein BGW80DRAFT_256054 [Lactifluus volemus]|nr:hypothetical protein BGW80DRAFT_256054 [Lactifluus volemus]